MNLDTFSCHGVVFRRSVHDEQVADCIFCGAEQHLYVNTKSFLWSCKKCQATGNAASFLRDVHAHYLETTTRADYRRLAKLRGLPVRAFERFRLAWNGRDWLIPVHSEGGSLRDIRRWRPPKGRVMSTTGCQASLVGLPRLKDVKKGKSPQLWLCEGEWDMLALSELLYIAGHKGDVVLAVPGAGTFKPAWVKYFAGRRVRLCYDNDEAGDKGMAKVGALLKNSVESLEYLCWPESLPSGWDVRDQVIEHFEEEDSDGQDALEIFSSLMQAEHRRRDLRDQTAESGGDEAEDFLTLSDTERPTFDELVAKFREFAVMDKEMILALRVVLAVIVSAQLPGDPVWMYLVAPPGGGKTLILCSTRESDRTVFRSSLNSKMLVSGWNADKDPSLLPKLKERALVCKDFTEVLSMPSAEKDQVFSILRGAYDGHVSRSYGNSVIRAYDDVHFSFVAGVTPIVQSTDTSMMGDRFLRLHMITKRKQTTERTRAAADELYDLGGADHYAEACTMVKNHLAVRIDVTELPPTSTKIRDKLVAICELIAGLRSTVERIYKGADEISFRPEKEYGTRLVKQGMRLAVSLAIVSGKSEVDEEVLSWVSRVLKDTTRAFHFEVVECCLERWLTRQEIAEATEIPYTSLARRVEDLTLLGLLERREAENEGPAKRYEYRASRSVRERWAASALPVPEVQLSADLAKGEASEEERPEPTRRSGSKAGSRQTRANSVF